MKLENKIKRKISKSVKKAVGLGKKSVVRNDFSKKTIQAIRQFQKGYCEIDGCSERRFLEKDHIRGRDNNSAENCQLLCPYHHRQKTRRDKTRKQIAKRLEKENRQ